MNSILGKIIDNTVDKFQQVADTIQIYYSLDPETGTNVVITSLNKSILQHSQEDVVTNLLQGNQGFLRFQVQNPERAVIFDAYAERIQSLYAEAYNWLKMNPEGFIFSSIGCNLPTVYGLGGFQVCCYFSDRQENIPDPSEARLAKAFRFDNEIVPYKPV